MNSLQTFTSIHDPQVASLLKDGAIGVLPSDTVYGVVACAGNKSAVAKLYEAKHREGKPGTIIAGKLQELIDLGLRARYLKAVEGYWPNPLSVVIPCGDELKYLHLGQHSLAVRIPADDNIRTFLAKTGPLLTSSANQPGEPVATTIQEAKQYFGESVDFYVDGGNVIDHVPSTVIRVVDDAIEVLRPGAVRIDENGRIST